jgi:hypothetical protein
MIKILEKSKLEYNDFLGCCLVVQYHDDCIKLHKGKLCQFDIPKFAILKGRISNNINEFFENFIKNYSYNEETIDFYEMLCSVFHTDYFNSFYEI